MDIDACINQNWFMRRSVLARDWYTRRSDDNKNADKCAITCMNYGGKLCFLSPFLQPR